MLDRGMLWVMLVPGWTAEHKHMCLQNNGGAVVKKKKKNPPASARDVIDMGSTLDWEDSLE